MVSYPDDDDGAVLARLAAHGIDMTLPLLIEFPVEAPDEESANKTLSAMSKAGYDSEIEHDPGEPDDDGEIDPDDEEFGPSWTIYTRICMVPAYDEIVRIQSELDRIAQPFGGYSCGWGVLLDEESEESAD